MQNEHLFIYYFQVSIKILVHGKRVKFRFDIRYDIDLQTGSIEGQKQKGEMDCGKIFKNMQLTCHSYLFL